MAKSELHRRLTRSSTPIEQYFPLSTTSTDTNHGPEGKRPCSETSIQSFVGERKSISLKHELRDIQSTPIQRKKLRSEAGSSNAQLLHTGDTAHFGPELAASTSVEGRQCFRVPPETSEASSSADPVLSSTVQDDSHIIPNAGYAQTISSDEETNDVPFNSLESNTIPVVASDLLGLKQTSNPVCAHASEWRDDDSDETNDAGYAPSDLNGGKTWEGAREACLALRRENNRTTTRSKQPQRRSKIVTLSVSPQQTERKMPKVTRSTGVKSGFGHGRRVVARDGYSQTPNAIDYRARKAYQKELEETLREALDQDIVQQVEAEGWITPIGRLIKAGVRMMERVQEERESVQPSLNTRIDQLDLERRQLKIQALEQENERLRDIVDRMKDLLNGGH